MGRERRETLDKEPVYCIHEECDLLGLVAVRWRNF